ncbi:amidase [Oceanicella sp. SM1341]|uniref:amidase n=1 Tax=Oceanicella sp. SM1341 TaxID=1548889 RepID=UPI001E42CD1C|nr:amidase [Oceanicella sp. SM1341]
MNISAKPPAARGAALPDLDLMEVSAMIAARVVGPVEVTEAVLDRIEAVDGTLGSYITVMADHARERAAIAEAEIAAGLRRGPLHGVPVAVKDLCETASAPTSAGMQIHKGVVTGRDSTVVSRLERAGAVLLGKLAMTEGAYSGHHPKMPTPLNPWNREAWAGSSSSGSGAATAAGLCYGSLGSDTGGSIRFPSSANGLTGLKGTWGRVSRHGVFALADSLDHVGPMARSARDAAAMMGVLAGADPMDPTALQAPVPDYLAACAGNIRGLRIGLDEEQVFGTTDAQTSAALQEAVAVLRELGAHIVPVRLPVAPELTEQWTVLCGIEVAIAHAETYPARKAEYGPHLAGLIDLGLSVSGDAVGRAMQWRLVYNGAVAAAMQGVDMLVLPVTAGRLPPLDNPYGAPAADPENPDLGDLLKFTAPADLTGCPSLTLPGGFDEAGVPIGFQLMGPALSEAALLRAGHAFQTLTDWHTRRPDLSGFTA